MCQSLSFLWMAISAWFYLLFVQMQKNGFSFRVLFPSNDGDADDADALCIYRYISDIEVQKIFSNFIYINSIFAPFDYYINWFWVADDCCVKIDCHQHDTNGFRGKIKCFMQSMRWVRRNPIIISSTTMHRILNCSSMGPNFIPFLIWLFCLPFRFDDNDSYPTQSD